MVRTVTWKAVVDMPFTNVDAEDLRAIIDFSDAAGEWGSVVPLPGKYALRMEELAKMRSMAE